MVGARPQFVKLAPICRAMGGLNIQHQIVHTGQHYDANMSDSFFVDLQIPAPDLHLGVGSGSHGAQTGRMIELLESAFVDLKPDCILVYGDTNSTLAAALAAVKIHLPLAHLEAGLRSRNRRMPEEHNRVLTDHAADLCLAPTEAALSNLRDEGLASRSALTGDVMTDVCLDTAERVKDGRVSTKGITGSSEYILATIHRADNTDSRERLSSIIEGLDGLGSLVILPAHPRLVAKAREFSIDLDLPNIEIVDPLSYLELISLAMGARSIVTDSGGLQKEAFLLRVPCVTVRSETEWQETVDLGWNMLCNDPSQLSVILNELCPQPTSAAPYGRGGAALNAAKTILEWNF